MKFLLVIILILIKYKECSACELLNKLTICKICCCESLYSIKCPNSMLNNRYSETLNLNSAYFNEIQYLSSIFIDLYASGINFRIDYKTFSKLTELKKLTLINVVLDSMPHLDNQLLLEELTIQNSGLKLDDPEFCLKNNNLKRIDLSENELESSQLETIFNNCEQLHNLDLSYNYLNSLSNLFTYVSSIVLLNLNHNRIELINENDFDFLIDIQELSISNNKIRNIAEKAFFSLNKIKVLDLSFNQLTEFKDTDMTFLEFINLSSNQLEIIDKEFCTYKTHLKKALFSANKLNNSNERIFDECIRLEYLDLSANNLKSLKNVFNSSLNLVKLILDNNKLVELEEYDFSSLKMLTLLSISNNNIYKIHENAFNKLINLKKLDLSKNNLISLPERSVVYMSLEHFDISENKNLIYFPDNNQFQSLQKLNVHYPYHCCQFIKRNEQEPINYKMNEKVIKTDLSEYDIDDLFDNSSLAIQNETIVDVIADSDDSSSSNNFIDDNNNKNKVVCIPEPDPFQPCENLLEGWWFRVSVWFISLMGIISNLCVIIYHIINNINYYKSNIDVNVPSFLLTHLAIADSLMSCYLLFIVIKDSRSMSNFGKSALEWQRSIGCNLAGFLSVASSVSSALCLAFITFERYYAIQNSINYNKRLSFKFAFIMICFIWTVSLMFSFMPLANINSYSAYAICLPLENRGFVYQAYIFALNFVFSICFVFMCTFYAIIFFKTTFRKRKSSYSECSEQAKLRSIEDFKLARNILLLLTVNIFCWGPFLIFCIYSKVKSGQMNRSLLKIIAIFIIPFNSLINPFLYCLSRKNFRFYIQNCFARYKLKEDIRSNNTVRSKSFSQKSSVIA